MIEHGEGYSAVTIKEPVNLKRGKVNQKKQNIALMVESVTLKDIKTGKKTLQIF